MANLLRFMFIIALISSFRAPVFATEPKEGWERSSRHSASQAVFIPLHDGEEESPSAAYAAVATEEIKYVKESLTILSDELIRLSLSLPHIIKTEAEDYLSMFANDVAENQNKQAHSSAAVEGVEDLKKNHFTWLPHDIKFYLVRSISIEDVCSLIRVSKQERHIFEQSRVWGICMERFKFDTRTPSLKATKDEVIRYYLRVQVNLKEDPRMIEPFMKRHGQYMLNKDLPFENWRRFLTMTPNYVPERLFLDWKRQGYGMAIAHLYVWEPAFCKCLYDLWAQPGGEIEIIGKLYQFSYRLVGEPSIEFEKEILNEFHALNDESMIKTMYYIATLPKDVVDVIICNSPPLRDLSGIPLRLQVIRNIKLKIGHILIERSGVPYNLAKNALQQLIENAVARGEVWGYYLKTLGLKYGMFNFERNDVEARKFISAHDVPC
jgi:hypothetical protein